MGGYSERAQDGSAAESGNTEFGHTTARECGRGIPEPKDPYMSIFVDAAGLMANLGSLGRQFAGVDDPKFSSSEYLAASTTSMGADAVVASVVAQRMIRAQMTPRSVWEILKSQGHTSQRLEYEIKTAKNAARGASIICWTLTAVEVAELTLGFGPPCAGDDLKVGSQQFTSVSEQLQSALPDDNWQGPASQAYADRDAALQNLAEAIAELDLQLAAVVRDQADWVTHMRLGFGILKDLLLAALAIEWGIRLLVPPPFNIQVALTFAIAASALAMVAAISMLTTLCTMSFLRGQKADALTIQYAELGAAAAQQDTPLAQTDVAAAVESTVSSFEASSGSLSGMSAMPDIATLARLSGVASGSGDESASPSALMGEGESPGDGPPAFTPSQVAAMLGRGALSGSPVGQRTNPGKRTRRVGAAAEEAAPKESALATDAEGAGAEAAERAPIDVGAGAEPGTGAEPGRGRRA